MADTPTANTMIATIGATVVKNLLMIAGASLASHGLISGSGVETFVSLGMVGVGAAWSFWNSYGRAIVLAKLDVWKATAQAQAEALRKANVAAPTAAQIADKIPDPTVTATTVAKVVSAGCLALILLAGLAPAMAQPREDAAARVGAARPGLRLPIDPLGLNNRIGGGSDSDGDLLGALEAKLLPDLKFALNIARANNNDLTGDCWAAWIAMIELRQKANVDEQGNPLTPPSPDLITKFQKLADIRNALQPTSPFMRSCSPVITMVKSDVRKFIGMILTGGFGLAALGVGL